jgi:hypothetical protein
MVLTLASFRDVVQGFRTHKEEHAAGEGEPQPQDGDAVLSDEDVAALCAKYFALEPAFVEQVVVVRKARRAEVEEQLDAFVRFREENAWPMRLSDADIHPGVLASAAHACARCPRSGLPMLVIRCSQVDVAVASAREFQQHGQMMIERLTQDHEARVGGIAVELDFRGASFGILTSLNAEDLRRGLGIFRSYPVKVKKVYVSNASLLVRTAIKAVLLVASKNVRSKVEII